MSLERKAGLSVWAVLSPNVPKLVFSTDKAKGFPVTLLWEKNNSLIIYPGLTETAGCSWAHLLQK